MGAAIFIVNIRLIRKVSLIFKAVTIVNVNKIVLEQYLHILYKYNVVSKRE